MTHDYFVASPNDDTSVATAAVTTGTHAGVPQKIVLTLATFKKKRGGVGATWPGTPPKIDLRLVTALGYACFHTF